MDIIVEIDGRDRTVEFDRYVKAKTKQMREFGYPKLTENEVREQLERLLAGKKWSTVIGCFMESDKPRKPRAGKRRK